MLKNVSRRLPGMESPSIFKIRVDKTECLYNEIIKQLLGKWQLIKKQVDEMTFYLNLGLGFPGK
jgi:hypothetical protein